MIFLSSTTTDEGEELWATTIMRKTAAAAALVVIVVVIVVLVIVIEVVIIEALCVLARLLERVIQAVISERVFGDFGSSQEPNNHHERSKRCHRTLSSILI